jgi:hypothetical protein
MDKYHIETVIDAWCECGDEPTYADLIKILEETQQLDLLSKQCRTLTESPNYA